MKLFIIVVGVIAITGEALIGVLTIHHLIKESASETTLIAATAFFTTVVNPTFALVEKGLNGGSKE